MRKDLAGYWSPQLPKFEVHSTKTIHPLGDVRDNVFLTPYLVSFLVRSVLYFSLKEK